MKKISTILIISAFILLGWQINAQSTVTVFSGESVPTEQGWTEMKLDATINDVAAPVTVSTADGVLKFTSVNDVDQFSQIGWRKTDLEFDLNVGFTIVFKAKVIDADKTAAFNIQGFDKNGKGFRIGILKDAVTEQTNPFAATNVIADALVNDDAFHTYRLTANPADGTIEVLRDEISLGSFPATKFQFDNIIENGGFEDEEFPDFITRNGSLSIHSATRAYAGQSSLLINSEGKTTNTSPKEGMTTRDFPVKPNTDYEFSMSRRRAVYDNEWAWRDLGIYWNTQPGSVRDDAVTQNDPNVRWWVNPFEPLSWKTGTEVFNKNDNSDIKTVRFDFPSWNRDGSKTTSKVLIDNIFLREKTDLQVGSANVAHGFAPIPFHDGYVNLIQNGGFEDWEMNNDGTPYTWALSNLDNKNENLPFAANALWNSNTVRIQRNDKPDDEVTDFARSGDGSLRFTTQGNNGNNFDFGVELEAGKTYRFNFWHRSPKWPDWGWLKVRVGEELIWSHELMGRNNRWTNCDLVFTATEENKTVHLYTTAADHGNWWNLYLDDLVLYEIPEGTPVDPQIAGKTNLIANGDFEDETLGNDGQPYTWALASTNADNDHNYPVAYSNVWKSVVRLQDKQKHIDTGRNWAHSGTKALRFSYLDNWGQAREFEGLSGDQYPVSFGVNIDFKKELEPNKTYTFVFWLKAANYNDKGKLVVANGDVRLWDEELSTKYINWTRQSITFTTTFANHTLCMFTEFNGWFNFYLDDLFLFEEDTYQPELVTTGDSYLAFGKSTGASSSDVEVEYIMLDNSGTFNPDDFFTGIESNTKEVRNIDVRTNSNTLTINVATPSQVTIYNVVGAQVYRFTVENNKSVQLPAGTYIVKSHSAKGQIETVKVISR